MVVRLARVVVVVVFIVVVAVVVIHLSLSVGSAADAVIVDCCCVLCIAILSSPRLCCTSRSLSIIFLIFHRIDTHNIHVIAPFRHIYGSVGRSVRSVYKISVR